MQDNENFKANSQQSGINLKNLLYAVLSRWYWFVISVFIFGALGIYQIKKTEPVFTSSAQLLLKDEDQGNSSGDLGGAFSNMGVLKTNTNIQNEILTMTSSPTIREVVKRLNLMVNYTVPGRLYNPTVYGHNLPIIITFNDVPDDKSASLTATVNKDGSLTLSDFNGTGANADKSLKIKTLDKIQTVETPLGKITIAPNPAYKPAGNDDITIFVSKQDIGSATGTYVGRLHAKKHDDCSVINLTYNDVSSDRCIDFLNTLIEVYQENWVRDKNRISISTSEFIKERLAVIEGELGNVDSDISSYKSSHRLPDVDQASALYFQRATTASDEVLKLNNRLGMARYIRNYLSNSANSFNVLPANSGLENLSIEGQITAYNNLLLKRNQMVSNSSASNPLVVDTDNQLAGMREAILTSIDNYIVLLNSSVQMAQTSQAAASSQLAANPTQARYLLSVERQQKVKENLYLYLLQKREENELSQAFTAYNSRLIAPPARGGMIAPTAQKIMMMFLLIGLAIPSAGVYLAEMFNTKVRGRKDIESLTVPFLGEIPLGFKRRRGLQRLRKAHENELSKRIVMVKRGCGNVINEAFRVIRTNLEMMTDGESGKGHVIGLTSANPGSGKTFITMNLAAVLAIKNKKVIIVDLDLRKASLSKTITDAHAIGVTSYLSGHAAINDLITSRPIEDCKPEDHKEEYHYDVITVGAIPPNPAELLYSPRLKTMLDQLREEYDYVLLDCPPVEVIADTKIINRHVDLTLFIIRSGLLERDMLPYIQQFYDNQRYHNMAIILNGTNNSSIAGIRSNFGYGYGYGYGYGSKRTKGHAY